MKKFSGRMLIALLAVAGLVSACGKSQDAAVTADQIENGEGVGPSLVTRTNANGGVEVAFANKHLTSEEEVIAMMENGQLQFVPIEQVMNDNGDDFALQAVNNNGMTQQGSLTVEGRRGNGNGTTNVVRRGRPTQLPGNVNNVNRRQIRRIANRVANRQIRRAVRRSRWYTPTYAYYPPNYYSTVNWVQPTYITSPTAVQYVNSCQQYIAYQNSCYQPVSTSLNVAWSWRMNCNYNGAYVQVYF